MARDAVITGMGVVSPSGSTLADFRDNLWSGRVSIEMQEIGVDQHPPVRLWVGQQPALDPSAYMSAKVIDRTDRAHQYAIAAAEMARQGAGLEAFDPRRSAIVSGTSGGGSTSVIHAQYLVDSGRGREVSIKSQLRGLANMAAAQMAMRWGIHGPQLTLCHACATGVDVVGTAADLIRRGRVDVAVAGGYDGGTTAAPGGKGEFVPATQAAQIASGMIADPDDRHPSRPFDKKRSGVVSADGAGFVIMESAEHAAARGQPAWAVVEGYGSLGDAYHPSSPDPSGRWEREVMLEALGDAGVPPDGVDAIVAHGTSTIKGDASEINAINSLFGDRATPIPVTSIKGHMGHPGAASGCLAVIAAALSIAAGSLVHTAGTDEVEDRVRFDVVVGRPRPLTLRRILVNAFGFGGQNACVLLRAPDSGAPR